MNCERLNALSTDYLDQALSRAQRRDFESHLSVCTECRSQLEVFRQIDQSLRIECGLVRQSIDQACAVSTPSRDRILSILKDGSSVAMPKGVHERLWQVRWVLALLCGSNTATCIIDAAGSHAGVPANTEPGDQRWVPFFSRLSFLTTEICGCSAGELIRVVGE
jgi:anti-sigma factor RsiW